MSNHNSFQIELLRKYVRQSLVLNQLELNITHHHLVSNGMLSNQTSGQYANAMGILEYCRLHDIMIQAWSPLARGQLVAPKPDAPETVKKTAALVAELAEKKNTTREGIALGWLLRHPAKIQPILGTHKVEHIASAVAADKVELSRQEWYSLLEAARGAPVP